MKVIEVKNRGEYGFPDSMSDEEIQQVLIDQFPPDGRDIDEQIKADPSWEPDQEQYQQWKDYLLEADKKNGVPERVASAVDSGIEAAKAVTKTAKDAMVSYVENMIFAKPLVEMASMAEGTARGTQDIIDLATESTNPNSPVFKWKAALKGGGPEEEYDQFIQARKYALQKSKRAEGGNNVLPDAISQYADPKYSEGISLVSDPTLALPGAGKLLGIGTKEFAEVVGKGAQAAGRVATSVAKPAEAVIEGVGKAVDSALAVEGSAKVGQIGATLGGAVAGDAVIAGVPAAVQGTKLAGEVLDAAGKGLESGASRLGPMERAGAAVDAGRRGAILAAIGKAGGDFSIDIGTKTAQGALEGAVMGAGMGYLQGNVEEGIGAGAAVGAMASAGARLGQKITGIAASEARAADFARYLQTLDPNTKGHFEALAKRHGVDAGAAVMDLREMVSGALGDIPVRLVGDAEFQKNYGKAQGVTVSAGDRPEIVINVDRAFRGSNPVYTLAHEAWHAFGKVEQLTHEVSAVRDALVGRYMKSPTPVIEPNSGAKIYKYEKLQDGLITPREADARFATYYSRFPEGSEARKQLLAMGREERFNYIADEIAAEYFATLVAGQKPDALLRGFNGLSRQLLDMALTQQSSKTLSNLAASVERTLGITPSDSMLFPGLRKASPQIDAMMRGLVRARKALDRVTLNDRSSVVIKPTDMKNPVAAEYAVKMGIAENTPSGVKWLDDKEIQARETKDSEELFKTISSVPDRDGTGARVVDDKVQGKLSQAQVEAIATNPVISESLRQKIALVNNSIGEGKSIWSVYAAATKRAKNKLTKAWRSVYSSGVSVSQRELLPYTFEFSKAGNPYFKALDLSKIRTALEGRVGKMGEVGPYRSIGDAFNDLSAYLTNLDRGTAATRSVELFGADRAQWLRNLVFEEEKGGSKFVRSFRVDRTISTEPRTFQAKMSETAYQMSKQNWLPDVAGSGNILNGPNGYRIIKGAKFRLYDAAGLLIGIFDKQADAEAKADKHSKGSNRNR